MTRARLRRRRVAGAAYTRGVAARVLVTDVEERAALAVCRGLAAAGYRVSGVAGTTPAAGHWSRSVDRRYTLPNPRLDGAAFVAGLAEIAAQGEHDVLIPSVDAAVLAVSEHRDLFEPHLRLGLPPHEVILRCLDKVALFEAAAAVGLGAPPTETHRDVDGALAAAARLGYPVVLKAVRSLARDEQKVKPSSFAHDERELRALVPEYGDAFVVQRRERGAVVECGGVVADGKLIGLSVARYRRTWPPDGGSASLSVTVVPPRDLIDRLQQLLDDLGWQGIFDLELVELEDGRPATIDFNARPYGSMTLAVEAGANLPALWCDWLLGRSPAPARSRAGVPYRWEEAELLNVVAAARRGRIGPLVAMLRPYRGTTHAFFRSTDPAPLVARAIAVARGRSRRR
jgi:predicted ATP-grasp superfamily ATP-dependent carboligase